MKPRLAALAVIVACGCGHATSTETPDSSPGPRADRRSSERQHERGKRAITHDPERLVTAQPDDLLVPGAENRIRDKLDAAGYLGDRGSPGGLAAGLRRFQADHDLPATGVADRETVKKLGLDPEKVFRRSDARR